MEDIKELSARMDDLLRRVEQTWQEALTDFMPAHQAKGLMTTFRHAGLFLEAWGGYEEAERQRILIRPDNRPAKPKDFDCVVLLYRTRDTNFRAGHRDYLGALLALGFERSRVGDLIAYDDGFDVICVRSFVPFFREHPLQLHGTTLSLSEKELEDWSPPKQRMDDKVISVDSLRLDAVLARAFDMSRNQAKSAVSRGLVKMNNKLQSKSGTLIEPGMTFSCRGRGKAKVLEVLGESRKGKTRVKIGLYQ